MIFQKVSFTCYPGFVARYNSMGERKRNTIGFFGRNAMVKRMDGAISSGGCVENEW
jgi:hypothetical protein